MEGREWYIGTLARKPVHDRTEHVRREILRTRFEQERWAASLLNIQPNNHLLEIDCRGGGASGQSAEGVPMLPVAADDSNTVHVRRMRTRSAASVQAFRLSLQPGSDGRLPFRDEQFDKAVLSIIGPCTLESETLHEVRRVLTRDCRLAVVQWPVAIGMYREAFRPEYDDQVQTFADELKVGLQDAGFGRVQLQFKPTDPIATLCAVAEGRTRTEPCTSFPVFSGFWW